MYSEPNLHSRNLKLVSLFFILYWVLGLKPLDDTIRLLVINYEISNPSALQWVSYTILIYFAWRFYLNSRRRIRVGYRKSVSIHNFPNKESRLYKKLVSLAKAHYIQNKKQSLKQLDSPISTRIPLKGLTTNCTTYMFLNFLTSQNNLL